MTRRAIEQFDDEINLFELVESLWKEKVLIVAITSVITLIGLGYVFLTPLTYEARVEILPPSISDIAELEKFNVLDNKDTSSIKVFTDFLSILESNQLRKAFLLEEGRMESLHNKEMTLAKINNMIYIEIPKKGEVNKASFKLRYKDPDLAAKFANRLVDIAIEIYRTNASLAFISKKEQKIKKLNDRKISLISMHKDLLNQEITKLKEAYVIAEKLDIVEPRESRDLSIKTESRSSVITEEMRYLYSQGTRALNAEIEIVSKRKQNLKMVQNLIDIEQTISLLNTVSFDYSKVTPVNIDLAAETPESHIKPQRLLIVLGSVAIGGFLAIIFVLIRNAARNRKA